MSEAARAVPDAVPAVEMAADEHAQPLAGAAAGLLVDLQTYALEGHGVVRGHGARLFVTEDVGEIHLAEGDEGRGRIGGGVGKAGLVGSEEALLKAWNTGHPGGVTTVHANSAAAALLRLDSLIQESGVPPQPRLVAETVDLVVFIARTPEGRRVREVARVNGYDVVHGSYVLEPACSTPTEADYA